MNTHRFFSFFCLCLLAVLFACEPVAAPQPQSCDYDTPRLAFSSAEECTPDLLYLRKLTQSQEGTLPELPAECEPSQTVSRIVELPEVPRSGNLILHVYNGSPAVAAVQIFGALSCSGEVEPLTDCTTDAAVAFKVPARVEREYVTLYVRIDLLETGSGFPYAPTEANFVALAAYDGKEPGYSYRMPYNEQENEQPGQSAVPPPALPVSCDGLTFQRVILSSCSGKKDMKAWADELGLPVSESYEGESGSVLAAEVPEGMDVQTIGGAAPEKRPDPNTNGGTVEPDYVISLFNPNNRNDYFAGSLDQLDILKDEEIRNCLAFRPKSESDESEEQVIVSIIDSGVDYAPGNIDYWGKTAYRQAKSTKLLTAGQFGFDFIHNDTEPEDETPHGTFVAGAVIGGYRGDQPLTTVHWKIFGGDKAASYYGALVAIREALTIDSDVINMSWGFYADAAPQALRCVVEEAEARGVVLTASAGNDTIYLPRQQQWPASFAADYPQTVVSVASFEYEGGQIDPATLRLTDFSNHGEPDVAVAAFMTTETPAYGGSGTAYYLGTSISTPIVTRTVANLAAEGRGDVPTLQSLYDQVNQLRGLTTNERYLPVCLEVNKP